MLVDGLFAPGSHTVSINIPATATAAETYARFRISTAAGLTSLGQAPDGEVEDYAVQIQLAPGDFDGDGDHDGSDIDTLIAGIAEGGFNAKLDLNRDGAVNLADRDAWSFHTQSRV